MIENNDKFNDEDGIFIKETEIVQHSEEILCGESKDPELLHSEYQLLSKQYKKLLRQTKKLVYMADNTQKTLRDTNELVHEKVKQLTLAEEKLKRLAITDTLTELYNRRGTYQWLDEQEIRYRRNHKPFTIFIIDIDFFKRVNDTYGHNTGDYVLKTLAAVMRSSLREQDCLGRWGGEEFILILPDTNIEGSKVLAEKMRKIVEELKIDHNGSKIELTISLGGCCYSKDSELVHCLDKADKALYQSKINGRNMVNVDEN